MSNQQNKTQLRLTLVLSRLINMVQEDSGFASPFSDDLDSFLDDILGQDGFGSEGQTDPRGDFRNDQWSMDNVEGIDDDE